MRLINATIAFLLIVSVIGFGFIVLKLDPNEKLSNPVLLYADLFAFIFSTSFFIGFYLKRKFGVRELLSKHTKTSLRQSLWFGIIVVCCAALFAAGLFNLWNAMLLVACFIFLESYFLSK